MQNKLTLLIDFNWFGISRASVLMKGFEKSQPKIVREQTAIELKELFARSINIILNRFKEIDNIIIVSDGGSWRKQLPIPKCLENVTYKGNRSQSVELDWDLIYKTFEEFIKHCKEIGITCTSHFNIEGDDWVWYWSRRLNSEGIHTMIWSSDNDLKQLVQIDENTHAFTAWYNDKNGLWLPKSIDTTFDEFEFFMKPEYTSYVLETIKSQSNKKQVSYIDPLEIILNKIFCGDAGDNIKSIIRYEKNGRIYRFSEKDYEKIVKDLSLDSIDKFLNSFNDISKYICELKKYKPYHIKKQDIIDMLEYNTKLVWLCEKVIPETIIVTMNQQEYKNYDLNYIKSNFKILLEEDDSIKEIFEDIFK